MTDDFTSLERGLCPACGDAAETFESGLSSGWKCTNCDWSIATANSITPTFDDQSYDVWLEESPVERTKKIAFVAMLLAIDIKSARSRYDSEAPLAEGIQALEVKKLHKKFKAKGLGIRIKPDFPWPLG